MHKSVVHVQFKKEALLLSHNKKHLLVIVELPDFRYEANLLPCRSTLYCTCPAKPRLAKRAAAEVTKQDMRKPRFVAGLVGSLVNLFTGPWFQDTAVCGGCCNSL